MEILKTYLTSLEPDLDQTIYSQSIGGHISNSLVYPETTLSSTMGLYDINISLDTPASGSWSEWQGIEYINIGNEVIKVPSILNGSIVASQRGYNNIYNMHIKNDTVRASSSKELFNDVLNDSHKQYRCIAIKNVSRESLSPSYEQIAYNVGVYLKQNSRNDNSSIKIALEKPSSQYILGMSTSWNQMQLVDETLINAYGNDYFKDSYLKIMSGSAEGQGKIISSFDPFTGAFGFYSTFSSDSDFLTNVSYEVLPSPAQRIKTGTISPVVGSDSVTVFLNPGEGSPIGFFDSLNPSNPLDVEYSNLNPNDVMYVWIEREVAKVSPEFLNNDFVINVRYKVS